MTGGAASYEGVVPVVIYHCNAVLVYQKIDIAECDVKPQQTNQKIRELLQRFYLQLQTYRYTVVLTLNDIRYSCTLCVT